MTVINRKPQHSDSYKWKILYQNLYPKTLSKLPFIFVQEEKKNMKASKALVFAGKGIMTISNRNPAKTVNILEVLVVGESRDQSWPMSGRKSVEISINEGLMEMLMMSGMSLLRCCSLLLAQDRGGQRFLRYTGKCTPLTVSVEILNAYLILLIKPRRRDVEACWMSYFLEVSTVSFLFGRFLCWWSPAKHINSRDWPMSLLAWMYVEFDGHHFLIFFKN